MTEHEIYRELVAGLALDALEPADEGVVAAHLPSCPSCRDLLADLRQTAADLSYAIPHEDPPPELLERILAAVSDSGAPEPTASSAADSVVGPVVGSIVGSAPGAGSGIEEPPGIGTGAGAPVRALPVRRRLSVSVSLRTLAVAAGVALLALVGVGVNQIHSADNSRAAALSRYSAVVSHLTDPRASLVSLGSTGAARGTAVVDGRRVYLVVDNLGINDARTSTYVLWAQKPDGAMVGVSAFNVSHDGVTVVPASLPAAVNRPAAFAVSHENGHTIPATPSTAVLGPGRS